MSDGGPVYPVIHPGFLYGDGSSDPPEIHSEGLSLLDYFAGQALTRLVDRCIPPYGEERDPWSYEVTAGEAYSAAEAMLKEREKRSGTS